MPQLHQPAVPIAIIGIGCRFPGGVRDAESYWELMIRRRCAIREIPPDRWSLNGFYDPIADLPDRSYSKWGGFLDDISSFDPGFFGLSPRDAEGMDPQQRLLLLTAVEAASDARLPLSALREATTGVFVGVSNIDYGLLQRYRPGRGEMQAGTGTALSIVANRVSNRLDLSGPSLGVDTACSSALVAVDTACRHLADGSCDLALAGGVSILLDPRMFITFSRAHMLSPTGRIRAFDTAADGFVRGEGVGLVLLRRLDEALAAGDPIHAVIEATAVNQDGRTGTITEPSLDAQTAMLRTALQRAGIGGDEVDYVEAHGTGTRVGDPIEARAIGSVLGQGRARPLPIGSIKTNIGHLEPAAGIAGLIKAALVLRRGEIPASLGFEQANPAIDLAGLGLAVASEPMSLAEGNERPRAVINSFGFGGTNACAVLSAAGRGTANPSDGRRLVQGSTTHVMRNDGPVAIPLSGPTPAHIEAFAARLVRAIDDGHFADASLSGLARALATQREHWEHRAVVIAGTLAELRERLECLASGREWPSADRHAPPQILRGRARANPKLVLTMTGQGGQWWAMGRELIAREPLFRATFEAFDEVLRQVAGWSALDELLADEQASRIDDAAITPAVMFAFQAGLAEIWRARGVRPEIVLGHSFGEVTAAYLAGGIGLADVARLVTHRGLIRGRVDRRGTMAAIGLGADAARALLPADGSIEIGGYNAPAMVTLTGEEAAIDALIARLNADDPAILTRKLALDFAYHSSWFEPVEAIFKHDVGHLDTAAPRLPVVSTVTGALNADFSADYWWRNLRHPVLYQQGIETALELGGEVFLELGPHRTLSSMTAACAAGKGRDVVTVSTLDRRWGDPVSLAVATAQLYVAGVAIDWPAMLGPGGRDLSLPAQPWLLREMWSEPEEAARHLRPARTHLLLGRRYDGPQLLWRADISLASHPWLGDHRLDDTCAMPAAAYLEMMIAAAREVLAVDAVELVDVTFPAALYLGPDDDVIVETRFDPAQRQISIHSRPRGGESWDLRARARVFACDAGCHKNETLGDQEAATPVEPAAFYRKSAAQGYGWGREFQGLVAIDRDAQGARGLIECGAALSEFAFDPRVIDAALQLMIAAEGEARAAGLVPYRIERVVAAGTIQSRASAEARRVVSGIAARIKVDAAAADGSLLIERVHVKARVRPAQRAGAAQPRLHVETLVPLQPAVSARCAQTVVKGDQSPSPSWRLSQKVTGPPPPRGAGVGGGGQAGRAGRCAEDSPTPAPSPPGGGEFREGFSARGDWLVLGEDGGADAMQLVAALERRGAQATLERLPRRLGQAQRDPTSVAPRELLGREPQKMRALTQPTPGVAGKRLPLQDGKALAGIVYVSEKAVPGTSCGDVAAAAHAAATDALAFAQWLAAQAADGSTLPRIAIVTRGARSFDPHEPIGAHGIAQGPLAGLFRTLAMEQPGIDIRLIDLDPAGAGIGSIACEAMLLDTPETELIVRGDTIYAPRLVEREDDELSPRRIGSAQLGPDRNFALRRNGDGIGADSLAWFEMPSVAPGQGEVTIAVQAVGLNFRDVMAVAGLLPTDAEPVPAIETLGLELSGTVVACGAGVDDLRIGDRVLGMGTAALRRFATWPRHALHRVPEGLSPAEAAALPSAYLTAHYALDVLGRLAPGESVLIHSAAGGVGLAAMAIAKRAGARIIATAGTPEKRAHLQRMGAALVLDSRNLAFAEEVRRVTGGRGVDVVLNSLGGNFIDKSLSCLAPYGRFLELGKRDVHGDGALALRALRANASVHVIDLAALIRDRPAVAAQMMADVLGMLERGEIGPLPVTVHPAGKAREAFAEFAAALHVGKIAIDMDDPDILIVRGAARFDPQGTYLVTGGTRGFGMAVARWLAAEGAGRVVVASRHPAEMIDGPAGLTTLQLDVSDPVAAERAIAELASADRPLRGIVHAAVAYDDAMIGDITPSRLAAVMAPKVDGALHLTDALLRHKVSPEFFVSFSSLAQVVGWPGQASYAAANSFLEALAGWQRGHGINGQCINWGALGESGQVARSGQMQGYLESAGWIAMPDVAVLGALATALGCDERVLTIAAADWALLASSYPAVGKSPRLVELVRDLAGRDRTRSGRLQALSGAALRAAALDFVREEAARVLRTEPSTVAAHVSLADAGIDSLSSFELRNRIAQSLGLEVPMPRYARARTFTALADLVADLVAESRNRSSPGEDR